MRAPRFLLMKKLFVGVGVVIGVLVVGFVGAVLMQPATTHVERSAVIAATPDDIFPYLEDFNLWVTWSPWQGRDPAQTTTFSENRVGEGAWYEWKGNDQVGHGRMTITHVVPGQEVDEDLHFMEPFEAHSAVKFVLTPEGEGTKVVWAYDQANDFSAKAAGLFMDMDTMLGGDFASGLATLKPLAEGAAARRKRSERAHV